ncbi:MAG: SH3 domain-containing protein [Lachnospiraceae bacterium]|nr:SH3 domain-containing protein [Lachnospiraceae bacterium]
MRHGSRSLIVMMVLYLLMAVAGGLLVKQSESRAAAERAQHEVTVVSPGTPEEIERLLDGPSAEEEAAQTEALLDELLRAQEEKEAAAEEEAEETQDPDFVTGNAALEVTGNATEQLQYFRFRITTNQNQLNVRKEPKADAEIVAMLPAGTTGYVLYRGEEWSEIVTDDSTVNGYCSNDYLFFTEVEETAFPAFIRREVRPSVVIKEEEGMGIGDEN